MLMITSFTNPRIAQAFVDYMQTQGVILTIQHHSQCDIWLADESQAERVKAELARFLEKPHRSALSRRKLAIRRDGQRSAVPWFYPARGAEGTGWANDSLCLRCLRPGLYSDESV